MKKVAYTVGGKKIDAYIPDEVNSQDLEQLYDIMNDLFEDDPSCFYTSEKLSELKKDKNNIFLKK